MPPSNFNYCLRTVAAWVCYFFFGVGALLPGIYFLFLAVLPLEKPAKQRKVRNVIQRLCRFYVDLMERFDLYDYHLEDHIGVAFLNRESRSIEGHMVISNHTMLIDALFVLAYVDNLCCVVKQSLLHNPFTRVPVKLAGYIPNNHEQLVELATAKLQSGENVLIFPEGTRNHHDLQLDFKRGAANIAVASQAPILPIVLCCSPRALCKGDKWYKIPRIKSKVIMQFHSVLTLEKCVDTKQSRTLQYRQLTEWLRDYYVNAVTNVIDRS